MRTKDLVSSVRSSAATALAVSVWDISAPLSEVLYLIQGAAPHLISLGFFYPILCPIIADNLHKLIRSRAPRRSHPRRVGSTYLLSGLVKCKTCNRALSGQDAKSGQFSYYVCQSIMKRGKDACDTPRLNARRFEELVVDKIRSNILTEGSITELVRAVDEEMDGIASEQRKRLRIIDDELEDVKKRLGRIWNAIETSDQFQPFKTKLDEAAGIAEAGRRELDEDRSIGLWQRLFKTRFPQRAD